MGILRPDADQTDGTWVNASGNNTDLYDSINETVASDSDYIRSASNPANDVVTVRLSNPSLTPSEPAYVRARYKKVGGDSLGLAVRLIEGTGPGTEIAAWYYEDIADTYVDIEEQLTSPQFAAISDFSDLYLQFEATVGIINPDALFLDLYPGAVIAVSFRKLKDTYAGSACRIRRSSDNAEADIGFDGNGDFDTAAAAAHIGGGTGYLAVWYDQSGNGSDGPNTVSGNQLLYAASDIGGGPTWTCPTSDFRFMEWRTTDGDDFTGGPSPYLSGFAVAYTLITTGTYGRIFSFTKGSSNDYDNADNAVLMYLNTDTDDIECYHVSGAKSVVTQTYGVSDVFASVFDGANHTMYKSGVAGTPVAATPTTFGDGSNDLSIGRNLNTSQGNDWRGGISEAVIYVGTDRSANAVAMSNNMVAYHVPLLLDKLSTATAAYSLRKLRSGYTGSAVRIRRSSDNAEADIGFSGSDFDAAAAASHIGGGSGFVVTWYDQSGTGNDVSQATSANQPAYVASGIGGLPTVGFTAASDQYLFRNNVATAGSDKFSVFLVGQFSSATDAWAGMLTCAGNSNSADWDNSASFTFSRDATAAAINGSSAGAGVSAYKTISYDTALRMAYIHPVGSQYLAVNNVTTSSDTRSLDLGTATDLCKVLIGARYNGGVADSHPDGQFSEFVWFLEDQSSNLATIDAEQASYYGI